MVRRLAAVAASLVLVGACASDSSREREVLVDFSSDEFAMFVAQNFPKRVEVTPGTTVVFKQTWTGEPHTVTGGAEYNEQLKNGTEFIDFFTGYSKLALSGDNPNMVNLEDPEPGATAEEFAVGLKNARPVKLAREVTADYNAVRKTYPDLPDLDDPPDMSLEDVNSIIEANAEKAFEGIPFAFDEEEDNLSQNLSQACYLKTGSAPEDPKRACTAAQQRQPAFDGTQSVYNSGVLPYEGTRGNTFRMEVADETPPGSYYFYCAIHGLGQLSEIVVREAGTEVPSAASVRRTSRREAEAEARPLRKTYRKALRTNRVTSDDGDELKGPFAGLPTPIHGSINEFIPNTIRAKVGEPITWKVMGGSEHSISFDVPPYLPIIEFSATRVRLNPKVRDPVGGAPPPPKGDDETPDGKVPSVDGGTYDGTGFWSSGLVSGEPYLNYTVRISKPGNYPYACLIHPKMTGRVIVS